MKLSPVALGFWSALVIVSASCGSQMSTMQPTPHTLVITGPSVLTTGLSVQLTVAATAIPTEITWQTSAARIATVSATGIVTAIAPGTATITAAVRGLQGSATISVVQPQTNPVTLNACQPIVAPGSYTVSADLPSTGPSACLVIAAVAGVDVDCQGHVVPLVLVNSSSSIAISNCTLTRGGSGNLSMNVLAMNHASDVSVDNCTLNGTAGVLNSSNVEFRQNRFTWTSQAGAELVLLQGGSNNRMLQNTIHGGYDGGPNEIGADDGIVLENESGDVIQNNNIFDVFDAGIEGVDTVTNTRVEGNTTVNAGAAGIASYWCTHWTNNSIRSNSVSQAPILFDATYGAGPKCGTSPAPANFTANSFVTNSLRDPSQGTLGFVYREGLKVFLAVGTPVSGNLIQGNDFGPRACASVFPPEGFIDGGGNICSSPTNGAAGALRLFPSIPHSGQ